MLCTKKFNNLLIQIMSEVKRFDGSKKESQYTAEIIEQAAQVAREIIREAESPIRVFQFGQAAGELYVSRDPSLIVGSESFVVDGETFYIGVFLVP